MRIVCSLVSVTVIFQLELFIILNVNYHNVCSSNRPQLRVLPGSSISAPWRVDFRNWQVDYCYHFGRLPSLCLKVLHTDILSCYKWHEWSCGSLVVVDTLNFSCLSTRRRLIISLDQCSFLMITGMVRLIIAHV